MQDAPEIWGAEESEGARPAPQVQVSIAAWLLVSRFFLAALLAGACAMAASASWGATGLALPLGGLVERYAQRRSMHARWRIALEILAGAAAAGCVFLVRWLRRIAAA